MQAVPDATVLAPLHRRLIKWLPVFLLLLAAAAYAVATLQQLYSQRLPTTERLLRIEDQAWRKRVRLLQDPQFSVFTGAGFNHRIDTLQVTLVEALEVLADAPSVKLLRYNFDEASQLSVSDGIACSAQPELACTHDEVPGSVVVLRLTLAFQVVHASALLRLIDTLQQSIASRPLEVRGCSLQRLPAGSALQAECALDVYHWNLPKHTAASNQSKPLYSSVTSDVTGDVRQTSALSPVDVDYLGSTRLFFTASERQHRDKAGQSVAARTGVSASGQPLQRTTNTTDSVNTTDSGPPQAASKAGLQSGQPSPSDQTSTAKATPGVVYTGYVSSGKQLRVLLNGVPWHASSGITWTVDSTEQADRLQVVLPSGSEHSLAIGQGTWKLRQ